MNIIITGGTDGMGKAIAKLLAARLPNEREHVHLVIVGRSQTKGDAAVADVLKHCALQHCHTSGDGGKKVTNNSTASMPKVEFIAADLSSMSETRRLASIIQTKFTNGRVDVLIMAAGGPFPYRKVYTLEGIEYVFALHYLSRYVLMRELLPMLSASSEGGKVLALSGASTYRHVDFGNLQSERHYGRPLDIVPKVACLNYLLTLGSPLLATNSARPKDIDDKERVDRTTKQEVIGEKDNETTNDTATIIASPVVFYNYHPGPVRSNTSKQGLCPVATFFFDTAGRIVTRSIEKAAEDVVRLLTCDDFKEGGFYEYVINVVNKEKMKRQKIPSVMKERARIDRLFKYTDDLLALHCRNKETNSKEDTSSGP